jgi:hypothetical protein
MTAVPGPWVEVLEYYDSLSREAPHLVPLRDLAHRIASSGYAAALHPWHSMKGLCIAQAAARHEDGPHLRITPVDGSLEFRYVDTPVREHQWVRTVPINAGFNRFVSFLDQLNWFGGVHRETDS